MLNSVWTRAHKEKDNGLLLQAESDIETIFVPRRSYGNILTDFFLPSSGLWLQNTILCQTQPEITKYYIYRQNTFAHLMYKIKL